MLGRVRILAPLVTAAAAIALAAGADVGRAASSPMVGLRFERVVRWVDGHCGNPFLTSGPYVAISASRPFTKGCPTRFVVIDDRTGRRVVLRPRGSTSLVAFGAPWLLFIEKLSFRLYNLRTKHWTSLKCVRCMAAGAAQYSLGSRWLETIGQEPGPGVPTIGQEPGPCSDGIQNGCGPLTYAFYNLQTHRTRHGLPRRPNVVLDLNSPQLVRPVCAPLTVPPAASLTLYGRYALVVGQDRSALLERCGSPMHLTVDQPGQDLIQQQLHATRHVVTWLPLNPNGTWGGEIAGILLPSLRRFSVTPPAEIPLPLVAITALDSRRLYLTANDGSLWSAPLP